jgi:cytochrome c oxidase assembly protein subunit 15
MLLGILALVFGVPLWLGLAHQGGAAVVVAAATLHLYTITRTGGRG